MRQTTPSGNFCKFQLLVDFKSIAVDFRLKNVIFTPLRAHNLKIVMALDVNVCLKALSAAFCQYRGHTTDQSAKDLERQIDVSSKHVFVMDDVYLI